MPKPIEPLDANSAHDTPVESNSLILLDIEVRTVLALGPEAELNFKEASVADTAVDIIESVPASLLSDASTSFSPAMPS